MSVIYKYHPSLHYLVGEVHFCTTSGGKDVILPVTHHLMWGQLVFRGPWVGQTEGGLQRAVKWCSPLGKYRAAPVMGRLRGVSCNVWPADLNSDISASEFKWLIK